MRALFDTAVLADSQTLPRCRPETGRVLGESGGSGVPSSAHGGYPFGLHSSRPLWHPLGLRVFSSQRLGPLHRQFLRFTASGFDRWKSRSLRLANERRRLAESIVARFARTRRSSGNLFGCIEPVRFHPPGSLQHHRDLEWRWPVPWKGLTWMSKRSATKPLLAHPGGRALARPVPRPTGTQSSEQFCSAIADPEGRGRS